MAEASDEGKAEEIRNERVEVVITCYCVSFEVKFKTLNFFRSLRLKAKKEIVFGTDTKRKIGHSLVPLEVSEGTAHETVWKLCNFSYNFE